MTSAPSVLCVVGARPNFVKIKPILDSLRSRGIAAELVHTGQHYDEMMSDVFFDDLGIRAPDYHLGVGSGSHARQTAEIIVGFEALMEGACPRAVVVVGDVNSTLACALVAAKSGALVAHVEAGLRSRDWAMPEEVNRVVTDRLSDLLLAPSADAVENLRNEGYRDDQIRLVGNVMIDTLLANLTRARDRAVPQRFGLTPKRYGVVTLHRPSNVDGTGTVTALLAALGRVATRCPLIFPVHPRTRAALGDVAHPAGVHLVDPLGYLDFLGLQADAAVVLTDSGGIQEETTALGVPCLTLRTSTERPITVTEGTNRVVGSSPDRIVEEALSTLDAPPVPRSPALWDGHAGDRIAEALAEVMADPMWRRPTASGG
jgi:UDP-N-acetylglucosamine 2-epimerase (non-hydrolysing)